MRCVIFSLILNASLFWLLELQIDCHQFSNLYLLKEQKSIYNLYISPMLNVLNNEVKELNIGLPPKM